MHLKNTTKIKIIYQDIDLQIKKKIKKINPQKKYRNSFKYFNFPSQRDWFLNGRITIFMVNFNIKLFSLINGVIFLFILVIFLNIKFHF
jgi:hypothetical protein